MPGKNFHSVYMAIEVLLVECRACGKRSALDRAQAPIWQGNMTELRSVKFRCTNRSCGGAEVRLYIPHTEDEKTMWLAGDPLPDGRRAN